MKTLKTTEQINQIKEMKSYIAEIVNTHKETKKIARMSSKAEEFNLYRTASAQVEYLAQSAQLFVLYTSYYIIRHNVENIEEYTNSVFDALKLETQRKFYQVERFGVNDITYPSFWSISNKKYFYEVVNATIKCLEKYVERKSANKE